MTSEIEQHPDHEQFLLPGVEAADHSVWQGAQQAIKVLTDWRQERYDAGYEDGYSVGYDEGVTAGKQVGFEAGKAGGWY